MVCEHGKTKMTEAIGSTAAEKGDGRRMAASEARRVVAKQFRKSGEVEIEQKRKCGRGKGSKWDIYIH